MPPKNENDGKYIPKVPRTHDEMKDMGSPFDQYILSRIAPRYTGEIRLIGIIEPIKEYNTHYNTPKEEDWITSSQASFSLTPRTGAYVKMTIDSVRTDIDDDGVGTVEYKIEIEVSSQRIAMLHKSQGEYKEIPKKLIGLISTSSYYIDLIGDMILNPSEHENLWINKKN